MNKKEYYNIWLEENRGESCLGCPYNIPQRAACTYPGKYCYRFVLHWEEIHKEPTLF